MGKRKNGRIYWRERGGARRAYVDLRDLGGGREALIVRGEKLATSDPDIAGELASTRVKELEAKRRGKVLLGVERIETLKSFVKHHVRQKAKAGKVTRRWTKQTLNQLRDTVSFFGPDRGTSPRSVWRTYSAMPNTSKRSRATATFRRGTGKRPFRQERSDTT